jgi:hypothetical protein
MEPSGLLKSLTTVAVTLTTLASSAMAESPPRAKDPSVVVQNDSHQPVRVTGNVTVSGTANVNVTNSSVPVNGAVSINGTPNVNIVNTTPLPVMLSGAAGTAAEPAIAPYFHVLAATCSLGNVCTGTFPVVPAGMRLRVTSISIFARFQSVTGPFLALDIAASQPVMAYAVPTVSLAYYGNVLFLNQPIDYYFEAGQAPILELGCLYTTSFSSGWPINLTINGYLVNVGP